MSPESEARPVAERLQKYLARCGVASRRAAEQLITAGRVTVNGEIVAVLGAQVEPDHDRVEVDGRRVRPPRRHRYLIVHKPPGVVSTAADPEGRRTVLDLVPPGDRVFPVGRLDYNSEGLLILTNDGELAARLTHPRHSVEKEYRALVSGAVREADLRSLSAGVPLDGRLTAPARFEVVGRFNQLTWLRVVLHEGRNRQVRRMIEAVGLEVVRLIRTRIGPLELGALPAGSWRELRPAEIRALQGTAR
jgi:23S rRNA pseudouridine2605 synthase